MCGDEPSSLRKSRFRALHNHRQENERNRQVLRVEGEDEEGHLARRVILGIRVRVGEGEGGEKRPCTEKVSRKHLEASQRRAPKLRLTSIAITARNIAKGRYVGSQYRTSELRVRCASQMAFPPCSHTTQPLKDFANDGARAVQGCSPPNSGTASAIVTGRADSRGLFKDAGRKTCVRRARQRGGYLRR